MWAQAIQVTGAQVTGGTPNAVMMDRLWQEESVVVVFSAEPQVHVEASGDAFLTHGPRALALAIPSTTRVTRQFEVPGLADLSVEPTSDEHASLSLIVDRPDLIEVVRDGVVAPFLDARDPSGAIVGASARAVGTFGAASAHLPAGLGRRRLIRLTRPGVRTGLRGPSTGPCPSRRATSRSAPP